MKNVLAFVLVVASMLGILAMPAAAQNPYVPNHAKSIEITVPSAPLANPTGAITVAIGTPTQPGVGNFVGCIPAFPPVVVGCGSLLNSSQLAQAIANGINVNGNAYGYGAGLNFPWNRIIITGPAVPGQGDFWIVVFHGEIHPLYGLLLQSGYPVVNLCDGIAGNEESSGWVSSTGAGIDIAASTIADPLVGSFELAVGAVVPPNFSWDGVGQVSVESASISGFPTQGNYYLKLTTFEPTPNGNPLKFDGILPYTPGTTRLRLAYRYFDNELSASAGDSFSVVLSTPWGYAVTLVQEGNFITPASAGTRYCEADVQEIFGYLTPGMPLTLGFRLQNVSGIPIGGMDDPIVFVDDIQLLPTATVGEGNSSGPFGLSLQLQTASWFPQQPWVQLSAADKKVRPGGILLAQLFDYGTSLPMNATIPFVVMVDVVPFGSQQGFPLPGEPNAVGLSAGMSVGLLGNWNFGLPMLPLSVGTGSIFLPLSLPFDGIYVQAGVLDPSTLNGVRISNLVRHRFE